jgi:hypothetical protein
LFFFLIYSDHMVLTHPWWLKSFSADAWSKAGWQTVQKHLQHNRTQPVGFSLSKRKNKNGMKTTRKQVPRPSQWAPCVALASVANWSLSAFQGAASSLQLGARTMVRRARLSSFRWAPWPKEGHDVPRYWMPVVDVARYLRTLPKETEGPRANSANRIRCKWLVVITIYYNIVALVQLEVWEDHNTTTMVLKNTTNVFFTYLKDTNRYCTGSHSPASQKSR